MKKFDEKITSFLDLLDSFDPKNLEQLDGIPWPYLKLPPGGDSLVISEDSHQEVNVGQKALGYLKSCLAKDRPTKVDIEVLRDKILPTWKYYDDFYVACSDHELWVAKMDFNEVEKADELLKQISPDFHVDIGKNNGSYGLNISFPGNKHVLLMDLQAAKNEKMIAHEFMHFVQRITRKLLLDGNLEVEKISKIFNIEDAENVKYLLHPLEFWTNIYIDFFNGMQKIYWLKFKDIYSWSGFVESQLRMLSHGFVDFRKSQIFMLWKTIVGKNLFYINLLAAIGYADRCFYEKIIDRLKNEEPVE